MILPKQRYTIDPVMASSELPKLPSHAAQHHGRRGKEPLSVSLGAQLHQLPMDRGLQRSRCVDDGVELNVLERHVSAKLHKSDGHVLAPAHLREPARSCNVEVTPPDCRLAHFVEARMPEPALLNELSPQQGWKPIRHGVSRAGCKRPKLVIR